MNKILFLTILILTVSPSFLQGNAFTIPMNNNKVSNINSTTATGSILTIEKRINKTIVEVNESIFIELILTNEGDSPIYNINLTESKINNPEIITKNLFSPIPFSVFEAHEQRIISYSITSLKVTNITLSQTVATFQQSVNGPVFTSYSKSGFIQVKAKTITQDEANLNNLLIVSVLAGFYILILIVRILFKITKRTQPTT